jgi:hypothetical protein
MYIFKPKMGFYVLGCARWGHTSHLFTYVQMSRQCIYLLGYYVRRYVIDTCKWLVVDTQLTTGVSYGTIGNTMKKCFLSIHTIHPPLVRWLVLVHSGLQSERQSQPKAKLVVWYWSTKCIVDHLCWSPVCMVLKSLLK